jgi:hypothetical protein
MSEPFSDTVFGDVVLPIDVENAVITTLKTWMPTYLRFIERRYGLGVESFEDVNSWRAADTMEERFVEQQIPAVQVMMTSPVDIDTHATSSTGVFNGTIDVLVSSTQPEAARENAGYYGFALGLCLSQHAGLDGTLKVAGFGWEKLSVPAVGKPDSRWLALGSVEVALAIEGVFSRDAGPVEPVLGLPEEFPTARETHVTLEPEASP